MAGFWDREWMPLDFLAIGRGFGLSVWQTQSLWEQLTNDPRYYLAREPERLYSAMRDLGPRTAPQFEALAKRADDLHKVADELGNRDPKTGKPPTPEEALGLLRSHHELVRAENKLYVREHPTDKRRKVSDADAKADAQLLDASLQLSHLSPVVDGHIYEGSKLISWRSIRWSDQGTGRMRSNSVPPEKQR